VSKGAYYNEIDPVAAQWLRNLIAAGHIAPGDVDERSIEDVIPDDLAGYTQCHFFAGIGIWSHALRNAGWPDDRPVWTGSCPCQPFSAAGKGAGFADERHLWPAFHWLIEQRRPPVVFGEQVASKDGAAWLDLVSLDLERAGYAFGAVISPAAGYGAPHIRHRSYWVADTERGAAERHRHEMAGSPGGVQSPARQQRVWDDAGNGVQSGGMADAEHDDGRADFAGRRPDRGAAYGGRGEPLRLADGDGERRDGKSILLLAGRSQQADLEAARHGSNLRPGPVNGLWRDADWLHCRDAKWRPVEPGTFPLAHGASGRVGRLRAYGNGIVAPQAQAFVDAYLGTRPQPEVLGARRARA